MSTPEQALSVNTTPNEVLDYFVKMLRSKLGLSDIQCYKSIAPAYIEGQDETVLQVCPGAENPLGGGDGYQDGGSLVRTLGVSVTIWRRVHLDMHGHSSIALAEEGTGMMDLCETIREVFAMTVLGGLIHEPVRYVGATAPTWYDADGGILRRDISLSATWGVDLPTTATE